MNFDPEVLTTNINFSALLSKAEPRKQALRGTNAASSVIKKFCKSIRIVIGDTENILVSKKKPM